MGSTAAIRSTTRGGMPRQRSVHHVWLASATDVQYLEESSFTMIQEAMANRQGPCGSIARIKPGLEQAYIDGVRRS
jgi:hypothetical protein